MNDYDYNTKNNIDWQDVLELEPNDDMPEMVIESQTSLKEKERLREERKMMEESDHKLTEELFYTPIIDYNVIVDTKLIGTLNNTRNNVVNNLKKSGKYIIDNVVKSNKFNHKTKCAF